MVRAKRKLEFMSIYIITAFAFCYGPYYFHGIINRWSNTGASNAEEIIVWVQSCLYMAPVIYPVIFCFMLSDVQHFLKSCFRKVTSKNEGYIEASHMQSSPSMVTRYTNVSQMANSRSGTPYQVTPELPQ